MSIDSNTNSNLDTKQTKHTTTSEDNDRIEEPWTKKGEELIQ